MIVAATDSKFLPAACCTILSTKHKSEEYFDVERVIFAVDVCDCDLEAASAFLSSHGIDVTVRSISSENLGLASFPTDDRIPGAAYIRILLDQFIDDSYDRVLYLDSDTRAYAAIENLFNTDLQGCAIAAAQDVYFYVPDQLQTRNKLLGRPGDCEYFNSGVILFDWKKVKRDGLLEYTRQFILNNPESCISHDQDALNAIFGSNFKILDPRWNMIDYYYRYGGKMEPWIKHFTGTKPWNRKRPSIWADDAVWYKNILEASPWPSFFETQSFSDRLGITYAEFRGVVRKYTGAFVGYAFGFILESDVRKRVRMRPWLYREVPKKIDQWIKGLN